MKAETQSILESLEPLFAEAITTGKWFYSNYQDLWFSPAQLRKAHQEGRFIWGPINWRLRDPREGLRERKAEATRAYEAVEAFERQIATEGR